MPGTTLGTAYIQIAPSAQGIKGSIENVLGSEGEAAGTSIGTKIGSFAKKAIAAAGITTAVVGVMKSSIGEGAKLQQSYLGGLDTLYGEAAEGARAYAREAANAGISMNDYSEQAVSFGAALKAAYGGDTQKAMEAANTAILDMADNAAKMGTPIESVQQAYQGFAKGQYQLLDNLKLGYGGTKTEMERLLKDAEALTGVKYDINNLGDVYDAIHAIQGDLGLTGVAAKEASETFSGSFGAMKAAAQNLFGSLALGEGIKPALNTLISTANTFIFKNAIPMIGTIISGLPTVIAGFIRQGIPMLLTQIGTMIRTAATSLGSIANSLTAEKVKAWAVTTFPKILKAAGSVLGKFASGLIKNLPKIVVAIGKIGLAVVKGLGSAIWPKVKAAANGIKDRFLAPVTALKERAKALFDSLKESIKSKVESMKESVKAKIQAMKDSIVGKITGLKDSIKARFDSIKEAMKSKIESAKESVKGKFDSLKESIKSKIDSIKTSVKEKFDAIKSKITQPVEDAKEKVKEIVDKIKGFFGFSVSAPKIPLPHFSIKPAGWKLGDLLEGKIPSLGISWYAKGGIANSPNLVGIGEAGPEAILPLNPFWKKMDQMIEATKSNAGGITVNVYASPGMDVNEIASAVERKIINAQKQRRTAWGI